MKRLPPVEKIYEAYSAIADGRVKMPGRDSEMISGAPAIAYVTSSDRVKTYSVSWEDDVYSSNDNATYWQGYPGYPVLAVLMLQGKLPLNRQIADMFKDVNWKELNRKYKGDYAKALSEIMDSRGYNRAAIDIVVQGVYARIEALPIVICRGRARLISTETRI